jgi:hypothetical protein
VAIVWPASRAGAAAAPSMIAATCALLAQFAGVG